LVDVADRLRASESRFRAIYDGAPVAIVRITPDLTVAESNPGLTRILGYRADQLAGMALARFTAQDDREVFGTAWAELAAGDPSVEFETDAARADGSAVRLRWTATALHDERGMYLLAVVEDVTAERAAEAAERAARRELERVNQLKTDFISIVSHEFRTALTGVQGFSEVLRDQLLDPEEVREYAGDINADAKRLNRMITEMLDLDRLESGRVTVNPEPTDVAALLADAVSRAEAIGPEHRFEYRVDEQLPEVLADHDKITQVATNLLSNAVKYSPAGSLVEVAARASGDEVEISVRDHGPGIPAESRQAVFERFTRLETSGSRVSGTGLGLAIARQIVELHGGRIWVDNPDGGGACFHFTLKAVAGPRRRRKAAAQRAT
jgi:PAS domain S-box-containing protein